MKKMSLYNYTVELKFKLPLMLRFPCHAILVAKCIVCGIEAYILGTRTTLLCKVDKFQVTCAEWLHDLDLFLPIVK